MKTTNETAKAIYKLLFLVLIVFATLPANAQVASKSGMAKQLLQAKPAADRPSATDIAEMKVSSETYSKLNGVTHVYFQQQIGGIPVHNAILGAHITRDNQLLTFTSRFVPEAQSKAANPIPGITSEQAVLAAARQLGYTFSGKLGIKETKGGPEQAVVFGKSNLSLEDIPVQLMWQTLEDSSGIRLRLAWDLSIYEIGALNWWSVRIDAQTGEMLDKVNWVVHCGFDEAGEKCSHEAGTPHPGKSNFQLPEENWNWKKSNDQKFIGGGSYRVFPPPMENPYEGPRQLITNPADATASPFGWHDVNGAAGAEFTITRGNNVYAYTDTNANNSPDVNSSPNGGASLVFDYPLDLTQSPSTATNRKSAVTNLFYWNNYMHDFAYGYGFDELSGNFQQNNYGNGGAGNDFVNAEAQDGGGFTNANFATPPDGYKPRMQMYLGNNIVPFADGDLDNGVIAHEYTHGISNRLTGGPANTSCLGNQEQMGEGWSDFFALMTTLAPGDVGSTPRTEGNYLAGQPANGGGFRPTPYSTDMGIDPATYNTIKTAAVPHGVGYVWTSMLWDMAWSLMNAHGQATGYNEAMNLVIEGMKMQPCSPGFVDGRNAILAADVALYGGANQCLIWKAFARRGLGFSALQGSTNSRSDGTQAFDLPATCASIWSVPPGNAICQGLTTTFVINASAAIAGGDLTLSLTGVPAGTTTSFAPATLTPGSTTTLTFTAASTLPGNYTITVTGTNGSGSFTTDINFTVYEMPAVPVLVSPANGATNVFVTATLNWNAVPGATSYRLQVSTVSDFSTTVVNGTLTGTSYTIPGFITQGTTYYWHLQAIGPKCTSAYSATSTFSGGCAGYLTIGAPTLLSPANGATGVSVSPLLDWSDVPNALYYIGQIATDAAFTNLIVNNWITLSSGGHSPVSLNPNTQYFWRVRANNACNPIPAYSSVFSFTTNAAGAVCNSQASSNVPVSISTTVFNTVTSTINIPACGTVADINVLNLGITHSYMGALEIELTSPAGTTVKIYDNACAGFANMLINFDDESTNPVPCPPTGNVTSFPPNLLSAFDGESITGTWTLTVRTTLVVGGAAGSLNSWSLGFCYIPVSGAIVTCYRDADNDNFGNPAISMSSCTTCQAGWVQNNTDCDDSNPSITAAVSVTCYRDLDGDGYGDLANPKQFCAACGTGYVASSNDCDDNGPDIHPGATEICNGVDDDCDGLIDEGFDADNDGYTVCQGDCDDNNPAIYPGAPEICDGIDNNCNGFVDEAPATVTYTATNVPVTIPTIQSTVTSTLVLSGINGNIIDLDVLNLNISHSYINDLVIELTSPQGTTVRLMDQPCNGDQNILINFDNESPNSYSTIPCPPTNNGFYKAYEPLSAFYGQNPNGTWTLTVHDGYNFDGGSLNAWKLKISTPSLFYQDLDQDGYGNPAISVTNCTAGYVANNGDCNDNNPAIYPGAPEICDGLDNDCNGLTDETFVTTNHASANVPVIIPSDQAVTVTSTLVVSGIGTSINDLNLSNLNISHTYINDLQIDLTSPQGTTVRLINNICGSQENILINFDDESANSYASIPCPPTNNGTYKPFQLLSAFDGENPNGTWTLTVTDGYAADGGAINAWTLNINAVTENSCVNNLTINNITHAEGNSGPTTYTFTVSLSSPAPPGGVTFDIATQDNSATTANNDYVQKSLTSQTIPQGSSTYTFDVTVNGDNIFEPDETFFVNVTNVTGATLSDGQGEGTITNDDLIATSLTISSVTNPSCVGNIATFNAALTRISSPVGPLSGQLVTFTFSGPSSFSLSATTDVTGTATVLTNFALAGSYTVTASFANAGYDPSSDVLTQVVNSIPATPTITPGGPTTFCAGGSVTLTSSSATGNQWRLNGNPIGGATNQTYSATASGNYTVVVTAPGCPSAPSAATTVTVNNCLAINDVTQTEGNAGTTIFTFTVSLSAPAGAGGVTFDIATANNTATTANNDYIAKSLTSQTIPAGNSAYTFDVTVNGDVSFEPNETFFVNVTNVTGATVSDGQGLGTITNDDACITDPVVTNSNDAGPGSLRQAINDACPNSIITFNMATVTSPISLTTGQLMIDKNLTIQGPGANLLSIRGATSNSRVMYVGNVTATIAGLTIREGSQYTYVDDGDQNHYDGSGILNYGNLTLNNCVITNNFGGSHWFVIQIGAHGSGVCNHGTLHVDSTLFDGNEGSSEGNGDTEGGGLYNDGTAYINNSTFSNNSAFNGGGIANRGTMIITNSTINGNAGYAAGIYNAGHLTATNVTITANSGYDAGIGTYCTAETYLDHVNITNNSGYGIRISMFNYPSACPPNLMQVRNCILTGNSSGDYFFWTDPDLPNQDLSIYGHAQSLGNNIIGRASAPYSLDFNGPNDQVGTDASPINPLLGPLADNGGATKTQALLPGSPAIDKGSFVAGITTDQRGLTRPVDNSSIPNATNGDGSDIGAFEVQCSAPSFSVCPTNQSVNAVNNSCSNIVNYTATATGTPDPTITYAFTGATTGTGNGTGSGSSFNIGVTTVVLTATNNCGEPASCTFTVTVVDAQNPSITCPANITRNNDANQCGAVVTYAATASDNCPGVSVSYSPASGSFFPVGTTTVTATATDAVGHTASCTFTVTVVDAQNPSITCPANIIVNNTANQCGATVTYAATATDNCPGTTISYSSASGSFFPVGTTTVTATATDAANNTESCIFTVTVVDAQNPTITCPANITVNNTANQCGAAVTYSATAADNCPGVSVSYSPVSGSFFPVGTTTVTATATDAAGHTASCTFTVTVVDAQNPSITCPANITVNNTANQCGATVTYAATASDNCPGVSVGYSPASGSFFPVGTTTVTATATDAVGHTASCTFTVTVVDAQAPTITCPANITVNNTANQCGAIVTYSATASDNCPGVSVGYSPASGSFFSVGTTTVTATATDAAGNTSSCTFTVTVVDVQNPSITCPANITVNNNANQCGANVTYTATATDNCSATISYSPASGSFFPIGTTTVTATATDPSGRTASCTFTVTVRDAQPPTLTCPANMTEIISGTTVCSKRFAVPDPQVSDNCTVVTSLTWTMSGANSGQSPSTGINYVGTKTFNAGLTTVTYTAKDAVGNTSTCSFTIWVKETVLPTITCPKDKVATIDWGYCYASYVNIGTPKTSDNCGIASVTSDAPVYYPTGITYVTWTVTDVSGNTKSCTQKVTIIDNQSPWVTSPANVYLDASSSSCGASFIPPAPVQIWDNCAVITLTWKMEGATTGSSPTTGINYIGMTNFNVGLTTITSTVKDAAGNIGSSSFAVTITDRTKPLLNCPADITQAAATGSCSRSIAVPDPVYSDNCAVTKLTWYMTGATSASSSTTGINRIGTKTFNVGVTNVTYSIWDAAGNTRSCSFTVTVTDNQNPVVSCPADRVLCKKATNTYSIPAISVSDNCSINSTTYQVTGATTRSGTGTNASGLFNLGLSTITWTVTDNSGNITTCNTNVNIVASGTCDNARLSNDDIVPQVKKSDDGLKVEISKDGKLEVMAWPNPAEYYFNLKVKSRSTETVDIRMYDMLGKLVEMQRGAPEKTYRFGDHVVSGMYVIETRQAGKIVIIKVVKQ